MVRVPTPEEEDAKRIHRERENLVQERLRIENRIERDEFGDISLQEVMAARDCQD
jgi:transposase